MREMKDSGVQWVGHIPSDWSIIRIKQLADLTKENSFIDGDWIESPYITDNGILYFTTGNIGDGVFKTQGNGHISEESFKKLNCKYAYPGDLVFSRLNEPFGRSCILPNKEDKYVLAVDNVILRTNEDKRYICYVTQTSGYQKSTDDEARGSTMRRISRTKLGRINIPLPRLLEQQRIADFLDCKCPAIDNIVEKTKASIEEFKKYKQAVITESVTKGIRGTREKKDSGIAWIGMIPKEWGVEPLWGSIRRRTEINHPDATVLSLYRDYGVVPKDSRDDNHNVTSLDTTMYKFVRKGDFVINKMKAWQGSMAISDYEGIVSPAYHVCEVVGTKFFKKYLHYLLRNQTYLPEYLRLSTGLRVGQWDLSYDDLRHIPVIIPPMDEQVEIVSYIEKKCSEIDSLIQNKELFAKELESYKKSLIYEYVTGKKEVEQ